MRVPFHLKVDGFLMANDIDEAMDRIADHFTKLSNGVLPPDLFIPGTEVEFYLGPYVPPVVKKRSWRNAWSLFDKRESRRGKR